MNTEAPESFDELDLQLISLLREDPDIPTIEIASVLGVTRKTILNRLSSLSKNNLARVCVQWDMRSLGLDVVGHVYINPGKISIDKMAAEIAAMHSVVGVAALVGSPCLYVLLVTTNVEEFYEITRSISAIDHNISIQETEISVGTPNFSRYYGGGPQIQEPWPDFKDVNPRVKVDEFDFKIMQRLMVDAGIPVKSISREIDFSETMIRQRIKKMREKKIVHKTILVHPAVHNFSQVAFVRAQVAGDDVNKFCNFLLEKPHILMVMKVVGTYNVHFSILGEDLTTLSNEVSSYVGGDFNVQRFTILPLLKIFKYCYSFTSFSDEG